ncbi:MAG: Rrf2 family transcriptional regulator [Clostridia bacterium]|nr:Rrf2 family transcriptional regulator [Clostridia bacterium]
MRITQEADYALRIVYLLAKNGGLLDAATLSQNAGVTERFTVKILRKLMAGGIVGSKMGARGGYSLADDPKNVNMQRVIEAIDGPVEISKCLDSEYGCTRMGDRKSECTFHLIFAKLNKSIADKMSTVTFDTVIDDDFDVAAILEKF